MHENHPAERLLTDCPSTAFYLCHWGSLLPSLLLQPSWDSLWPPREFNVLIGRYVSLANHSRNPRTCGWSHFIVVSGFPHKDDFRRNALLNSNRVQQAKWLGGALVENSLSIQEIKLDRVGSGLGIWKESPNSCFWSHSDHCFWQHLRQELAETQITLVLPPEV